MLTGVTLPGATAAAGAALDANELPAAPRAPATTISRLVTSLDVLALFEISHRTCRGVAVLLDESLAGSYWLEGFCSAIASNADRPSRLSLESKFGQRKRAQILRMRAGNVVQECSYLHTKPKCCLVCALGLLVPFKETARVLNVLCPEGTLHACNILTLRLF